MTIIDLELIKATKNYKYFCLQYTNWWKPDALKMRHGFIDKKTNDCFCQNTGKRLIASTERAVLALVEFKEEMASIGAIKMPSTLNAKYDAGLGQITYTKS